MQVEPLLSVEECAEILGMKVRSVYELVEAKDPSVRLPVVRIGRRIRFRSVDIEAWIDARIEAAVGDRRLDASRP